MRVFAISDIHVDYTDNKRWLFNISSTDYKEDVLILAGDLTDNILLLTQCFKSLAQKFFKVLFIPGNHDLWVNKSNTNSNSIEKLSHIKNIAFDYSISLQPSHFDKLSIVPLFSWYDYSFAQPCQKLKKSWMDFKRCVWPGDIHASDINNFFLEKNKKHLEINNHTVISFSHFLPRIDLMPFYIPDALRYIYPVLGSSALERQIRVLKPDIHVYGHSHVNQRVLLDDTWYINNAFGYPSEESITSKQLVCVFEC